MDKQIRNQAWSRGQGGAGACVSLKWPMSSNGAAGFILLRVIAFPDGVE